MGTTKGNAKGERVEGVATARAERDAYRVQNGHVVQWCASWILPLTWFVNATLLVGAVSWLYFDGRSLPTAEWLASNAPFRSADGGGHIVSSTKVGSVTLVAAMCSAMAVMTLLMMLGGLFVGGRRFRSTRMWLAFVAVAAGWLGLVAAWPEIYWRGQQRRVVKELASVETMARYLDENWPREDGELPGIGPYLAYPKGAPTIVMPLRWITFPDTSLRFSAVERSANGTIRFELAGDETGAWLECREDNGDPSSFVGGLETKYELRRQQQVAPRWFLVRYESSAVKTL
jgi:hypothetical protein